MSEVSDRPAPSLDGRRFRSAADVPGGDVGAETVDYAEADGIVHARYGGGAIRLGFLVGTRDGDALVRADGTTATGRCESRVEALRDGPPAPPRDVGVGVRGRRGDERRRGDPLTRQRDRAARAHTTPASARR
jgi:hypothetical protein